jgi:signal transduction histidine kinase
MPLETQTAAATTTPEPVFDERHLLDGVVRALHGSAIPWAPAPDTLALELENERLRAELRAQTRELRSSRARLVAAADAERERLERNLHDGAQSRFVATALRLRVAQAKAPPGSVVAQMLDDAITELGCGIDELRELARGIHPAVLTERGLGAALESLAMRAPLPVSVTSALSARLPGSIEIAAYFAVSEAIANVAKHAQATHVTVDVRQAGGRLVVEIADDGRGGAAAGAGSGLRGLADRVGALDGRLEIDSPRGAGTRIRIEIPCPDQPRADGGRLVSLTGARAAHLRSRRPTHRE